MKIRSLRNLAVTCGVTAVGLWVASTGALSQQAPPPVVNRFPGPTSSQPLALDGNGTLLAVANPDNNTVSFFDVTGDRNRRLRELQVGAEPNGVVLNPQGTRAYVANTVSGTVSVVNVNRASAQVARVAQEIRVGTEPYGLALTPNGTKLYVTNRRSDSVSVIDTRTNRVLRTIENAGFAPTGIAITNDGDGADDDEIVLVTQFFAIPRPGQLDGEDDAKDGAVSIIPTVSDQVENTVKLIPIGNTGFRAAGDAIAKVAPPATATEADFRFDTGAYPNQLNNVAIKGNFAWIPNTGASPNGPVRFDVNTQALLTTIDLTAQTDAQKTINMHSAVAAQAATPKLFLTQPWAMAIKNTTDEGYVLSAASDVAVKVGLDAGSGTPRVLNAPGVTPSRTLQIPVGKNPRGIVINPTDTRAYVMNYVSRDVTVINLTNETVAATMQSAPLPITGTTEDLIHAGKELYHSSTGEFDGPSPLAPKIRGRMSNNGWGSCGSCHPEGLSDNVVWIFGAGPRRTVPQNHDYDPDDPTNQRAFNWSGIFDEQEDFEANIRTASGGLGLIVGADGVTPDPLLNAFTNANAGRRQLRIRGVGAWDAIKAYVQFGIRGPLAPVAKDDPEAVQGEQLFIQAKCHTCHGGPLWTSARVRFAPPPAANLIVNAQIISELRKVGTFDPAQKNEVRQNAAAPLGADGFVPPSLLGVSAYPRTYFHNGSADSLEAVMANVAHRSSGTNGTDILADENARRLVVRFLKSIDQTSTPIDPAQ